MLVNACIIHLAGKGLVILPLLSPGLVWLGSGLDEICLNRQPGHLSVDCSFTIPCCFAMPGYLEEYNSLGVCYWFSIRQLAGS